MACGCSERAAKIRELLESKCVLINNSGCSYSLNIPIFGVFNLPPGRTDYENAFYGMHIIKKFNEIAPGNFDIEVKANGS